MKRQTFFFTFTSGEEAWYAALTVGDHEDQITSSFCSRAMDDFM
ncbi:hypothetical protein D8I24_2320 (plasmid) [Cupriavidus necator H850]|nr:hypothetical protein D8I24_2320 [Cupriavidus necator H850]